MIDWVRLYHPWLLGKILYYRLITKHQRGNDVPNKINKNMNLVHIFLNVPYHHWSTFCTQTFFFFFFFTAIPLCPFQFSMILVLWSLHMILSESIVLLGFSCHSVYLGFFNTLCGVYSGVRKMESARLLQPTSSSQWTPTQKTSWKWGIRYHVFLL